jgi:hypothetical protein
MNNEIIKSMKTNPKYLLLAVTAVFTVAGMSFGVLSMAQGVPTLTCSSSVSSVAVNQAEVLTATGGNGAYLWSGPNLTVTNTAGSQLAVSYNAPGVYPITVASAGQTATCNVNVLAGTTSTGALSCFPATQNVTLGQVASVSATGGNGVYAWSSPDLNIANPNGSGFAANYATTGMKTLTVSSNGLVTTCAINVVAPVGTPSTPGLPNTGGGYGK